MPFTFDGVPIALKAKARRIPEWQLDRFGLVATLQYSPVKSDQPTETVTLIPMGAARLRISAFPVTGDGPDAHTWADTAAPKPLFHVSASHCNDGDTTDAAADGHGHLPFRNIMTSGTWCHNQGMAHLGWDFAGLRQPQRTRKTPGSSGSNLARGSGFCMASNAGGSPRKCAHRLTGGLVSAHSME